MAHFIDHYPQLDRFEEVILGDSEFIPPPGELYQPVSYAWKGLRSETYGAQFGDELERSPPHRCDRKTMYFGYTGAEPEFFMSVWGQFDMAFIDLRVEHINLTNSSERRLGSGAIPGEDRPKPSRSLIDALRHWGIDDGDTELKKATVKRILKGFPFNREERRRILKYCFSDVLLLEKLLEAMLPAIIHRLPQALSRGEYVKLTAEIFHVGQPGDPWGTGLLRRPRTLETLRLRAASNVSLSQGLYEGDTLSQVKLREFLIRHGELDNWRRTEKTKALGTANRDFVALAERHPEHEPYADLANLDKVLDQIHKFQMTPGLDHRFRTPIWPFSTVTSRMAPNGSAYPFTVPACWRPLIMPAKGFALAYLDFASMEFGVAAGLSQCPVMTGDYADEPYLILPRMLGYVPPDATRLTHGDERERYKPMILAIQYGGGADLMARRLDLTKRQGQRLVDLHHDRYNRYWEWSDDRLQRAFDNGELVARDGWRCGVSSKTSIFTARNWLIQAISAAIFRYACLMMRALGIRIVAVVHDAVLIEAPADRIDEEAVRAAVCLERASRRFLRDFALRVDTKVIHEGERFRDKRGVKVWEFIERTLRELEEGAADAAE